MPVDRTEETDKRMNGHCKKELCTSISSEEKSHFVTLFDYLRHEIKITGVESSFYTLDFGDIFWKIQRWKETMPNVRPFYAVKTNSDPTLLRLFALLGFSFDCASEGEIRMVMEAGGTPSHIIFAHTVKTPVALKYARSIGVDLMTFDSEEELLKVQKHYPQAKLLLRLLPLELDCVFDLSKKFGCSPDEAEHLLRRAKDLDLDVIGVCFHVGGLCRTANSYIATIEASRQVFDVARTIGFQFRILDIGGGFRGSRGTEDAFEEVTKEIRKALNDKFPEPGVEIIAEPGTYFVASAVNLITEIIGTRQVGLNKIAEANPIQSIEKFYYLNNSIYGSFFNGFQEYGIVWKPVLDESQLKQRPVYRSTVWGHTCCGKDMIVNECLLPDMKEGEYLMWYNMGAYSRVICSLFCGVAIPSVRHIFINNSRLNWKWLTNKTDIENLILKSCVVIDEE